MEVICSYLLVLINVDKFHTVVASCFVKIELFDTKLGIILQQRNDRTVSHNDRTWISILWEDGLSNDANNG